MSNPLVACPECGKAIIHFMLKRCTACGRKREVQMNQQDQIDIIKAHMTGKKVMMRHKSHDGPYGTWVPLTKGEYEFDFISFEYKIEPRKLELFMSLPSGVLQALGREPAAAHLVSVSNEPPHQLQPGYVIVKIHCTEPEN